jgi:hypothetical protein
MKMHHREEGSPPPFNGYCQTRSLSFNDFWNDYYGSHCFTLSNKSFVFLEFIW